MWTCCNKKKPKDNKQNSRAVIEEKAQREFRLNNQQLYEFTQRFESMASNGKMSYK